MTTPSMNDLCRLAATTAEPAVSLMQPVDPWNVAWNVTSWKNLLRAAERELLERGLNSVEAQGLLAPAAAMLEEAAYWMKTSDSVACFLSRDEQHVIRTPLRLPSLAVVGKRFHLLPFLPAALADEKFFILALSANHVRLVEATRFEARELDLDCPRSLEEAMAAHDRDRQGGFHTAKAPGAAGAGGTSIHHGQGVGIDDANETTSRFCKMVADAVSARLKAEKGPLVLAAAEGVSSLYRQENSCRTLLAKGLRGNPDRASNEALRDGAAVLASEMLDAPRRTAVERCVAAAGRGGLTMDLEAVVPGAVAGRVDTLLAPLDQSRWGRFDGGEMIELHAERQPGDEELTNVAALGALLHRSRLAFTRLNEIPPTIRLPAAILRPGF